MDTLESKMELYNELIDTKVDVTPLFVTDFLNRFISKFNYTNIDVKMLVDKIILGSPKTVNLNTFYNFVADQCVIHTSFDPEYNHLASNILVDRLHKATPSSFKKVTEIMYNNHDAKGAKFPMLSDNYYNLVQKHHEKLEKMIGCDQFVNYHKNNYDESWRKKKKQFDIMDITKKKANTKSFTIDKIKKDGEDYE